MGSRNVPRRTDAIVFSAKVAVLTGLRLARNLRHPVARHPRGEALAGAPVVGRVSSPLWSGLFGPRNHALTAGKIQNLRIAVSRIDGVEVPAGEVFSFWRHVGRATRRRGFVAGRELREGCIIPAVGGGLCQLSNALYDAALQAGHEIIERHAHSKVVPGSRASLGRDATVFFPYVDVRLRSGTAFRIEARLTGEHLEVTFRGTPAEGSVPITDAPRADAHDCASCHETSCHRHRATAGDGEEPRPTAWLVDGATPEFAALAAARAKPSDALLATRARGPCAWDDVPFNEVRKAIAAPALRSLALRRARGGAIARIMEESYARVAAHHALRVSHLHTDLVVAQSLLPHLHIAGALSGRTYEVLMERLPLSEIHVRLDVALMLHPGSQTLGDHRAPRRLVEAEREALAGAGRLHTAHSGVAALYPGLVDLLDWEVPPGGRKLAHEPASGRLLFPASALGRKGAYEVREAVRGLDVELLVTGAADEGFPGFWEGLRVRKVSPGGSMAVAGAILPAVIEHHPRGLLAALAAGIPVIASEACGLGERPGVTTIPALDADALRAAIVGMLEVSAAPALAA